MSNLRIRSVASIACRLGAACLVATPALLAQPGVAAAAPRIVCIGEQTTMTAEMSPTWPVKMQTDLGAADTVTDDGDGGGTVLAGSKGGTHTFTTPTNAPFKDSIMAPDIVVIGPWAEHDEIAVEAGADATHFQADYDALVMAYLGLPKKPCVIVTTPVVIPSYQKNPATDALVTSTIEPAVLSVAKARALPLVDLYTDFMGKDAWLGTDGHFTTAGAAEVARLVELALPSCSSSAGGSGSGGSGGAGGSGGGGGSGLGGGGSAGAAGNGFGSGGIGGAGGASAAAGGAQSSTNGGTATTLGGSTAASSGGSAGSRMNESTSSDSSGCAVSSRRTSAPRGAWFVLLGSAFLAAGRRLRPRARRRSRPAA